MIDSADGTEVARLRAPEPTEQTVLQTLWEASHDHDDPAGSARGGWSLAAWASETRVLQLADRAIGLAAVRTEMTPDGAMPGQLALDPAVRQARFSEQLVQAVAGLVRQAGGQRARLFIPWVAEWAATAAALAGFEAVRTIAHMLLPGAMPTPTPPSPNGITLRAIREDEDARVLAALNRAWQGTWNFVSITPEMLAEDLKGQRAGMLLGVDAAGRIVATCHALFEPNERDPDGGPRAWISNLTVDPGFRGRGLARSMLAAGIAHLRGRGASSITLGVDADDPAPFRLYESIGFQIVSRLQAWDKYPLAP